MRNLCRQFLFYYKTLCPVSTGFYDRKVMSNHRSHNNNISTRVSTFHQPPTSDHAQYPLFLFTLIQRRFSWFYLRRDFQEWKTQKLSIFTINISFTLKYLIETFLNFRMFGSFGEHLCVLDCFQRATVQYLTIGHSEDTKLPEQKSEPMYLNVCPGVHVTRPTQLQKF